MKHQFVFEVEGQELPFESFSVLVGERTCEVAVTVPPIPACFYLPPGSYMRLIYKDPVLNQDVLIADGVLTAVGFSKTAASQSVNLMFVDPIQYLFAYPLVPLEYNTSAEQLQSYLYLTEFLLQRTVEEGEKRKALLSDSLNSLLNLVKKGVTFGEYIKESMKAVFEASDYTRSVAFPEAGTPAARRFAVSQRYSVLADDAPIPTRYRAAELLEIFLTQKTAGSVLSVQDYFDYLLAVVRLVWYYQSVFLEPKRNILLVPKRFAAYPPSTNVFFPSMITMLDVQISHTMPTRVLEVVEVGTGALYFTYPEELEKTKVTDVERMRGVRPYIGRISFTEAVGAVSDEQSSGKDDKLKDTAHYFARKHLYELYLTTSRAQLKTPFYPYAQLGLPAFITTPTGHYWGIVTSARHEYTVQGDAASFFTLGAVTPVEAISQLGAEHLGKDIDSLYRESLGVSAVQGETPRAAAAQEYSEYLRAVTSNPSKYAMREEPEEALFWWAYERNIKGIKAAQPEQEKATDPTKAYILKSIVDVLKSTIIPDSAAESLQKKVADELTRNGVIKLLYPVDMWLEGR